MPKPKKRKRKIKLSQRARVRKKSEEKKDTMSKAPIRLAGDNAANFRIKIKRKQ